jgi:hypothetical protein
MAHVTIADVAAFHERTLDRARVESIGAHVRDCAECTRLVFGNRGVAGSVQAVWTPEAQPAGRWRPLAIAAAAALVAVAIGVWITREDPQRRVAPVRDPETRIIARMIRDGSVAITLDGQGAVMDVSSSRIEWNALALNALRSGELPAAPRIDLATPGEILRGDDPEAPRLTLKEPVGIIVESDRPAFRWTRVPGARYRVVVAHDAQVVAKSELLSETSWQPPQPLRRGAVHAWQLAVVLEDREWTFPSPEQPAAQFHILADDAKRELDAARERGSHLLTGLVAARHGLRDLARDELSTFAAANPGLANGSKLAASARRYDRPAPTTTNADQ